MAIKPLNIHGKEKGLALFGIEGHWQRGLKYQI
jgi:hypothetical protein